MSAADLVRRRADDAEHAAMFDMWSAAAAADPAAGLIAERVGDCLVIGTRPMASVPLVNRVMGADAAAVADGSLAEAVGVLTAAGCACQLGVHDETADGSALRGWASGHGFDEGYAWMKFVHADEPTPMDDEGTAPTVDRCRADRAELFGQVFVDGYELPPLFAPIAAVAVGRPGWHCYLATDAEGSPLGSGAMFVQDRTAWLGLGATLPAARRRGAQGALLRARVRDAMGLGCDLIVTETGERVADRPSGSYRNILRAGFAEHALRRHVVRPAGDVPG